MTLASEARQVAKVQKNFLIPEDLAAIIDKISELSGANFTKIATAALLEYVFHNSREPEHGPIVGPGAPEFMTAAVRLDRGETTIGNVASDAMKDAFFMAEYNLRGGKKDWVEHWRKVRTARQEAIVEWQAAIKEHKGELPAILKLIEDCFAGSR
jgi:hypothetical protein